MREIQVNDVDDLAAWLQAGTTAPTPAVPVEEGPVQAGPRAPRPDASQGSSASTRASETDPTLALRDILLGPRTRTGDGGWTELNTYRPYA